jgi:hemolysin activation/secretion protein
MRGNALLAAAMAFAFGASTAFAQNASSDSPKFEIREIKVEGNTLLKQQLLDRTFAPYIGPSRDFSDVQKALEALEKAYTKAGYGAIQVALPEQELNLGVVTLKVTESRIAKIVFEGNRLYDEANIRNSLPALKEGDVPNVRKMGDNLRLANESPSKQTAVILRNTETDGEVDAVVRVSEQKPTKFNVSLDNTGTAPTGEFRLGTGFQSANLFNRDQVLTAQVIGSPTEFSKVLIAGFGYHIPLYQSGDSIDISGGYSNVSSGTVQGLFNVAGKGSIGAVHYNFQLPRVGEVEQKLTLGYDYKAFINNITAVGDTVQLVPDITVHPLSLTYSGAVRFTSAESTFYLSAVENLPGGNHGGSGDFEASRAGSDPRYVLYRYGFNVNKAFASDWQMRVAVNGQWTRDALISGEQFGLGGMDNVRGFLERELSDDRGIRETVELYTPDFGSKFGSNWRTRALVFYDDGRAVRVNPLPSEIPKVSIASAGLGLRAARGNNLTMRLDFAYVLDEGGQETKGHTKAQYSLVYVF